MHSTKQVLAFGVIGAFSWVSCETAAASPFTPPTAPSGLNAAFQAFVTSSQNPNAAAGVIFEVPQRGTVGHYEQHVGERHVRRHGEEARFARFPAFDVSSGQMIKSI